MVVSFDDRFGNRDLRGCRSGAAAEESRAHRRAPFRLTESHLGEPFKKRCASLVTSRDKTSSSNIVTLTEEPTARPGLAKELVAMKVDVLVAGGGNDVTTGSDASNEVDPHRNDGRKQSR